GGPERRLCHPGRRLAGGCSPRQGSPGSGARRPDPPRRPAADARGGLRTRALRPGGEARRLRARAPLDVGRAPPPAGPRLAAGADTSAGGPRARPAATLRSAPVPPRGRSAGPARPPQRLHPRGPAALGGPVRPAPRGGGHRGARPAARAPLLAIPGGGSGSGALTQPQVLFSAGEAPGQPVVYSPESVRPVRRGERRRDRLEGRLVLGPER